MDQTRHEDAGECGFSAALADHQLRLTRESTRTLQVNVGAACNLACRHCHLEAGPDRRETMSRAVMDQVIAAARRFRFSSIDLTGGAPELVPEIGFLIRSLAPLTPALVFRTNLLALGSLGEPGLPQLLREVRGTVVASLPATNASQTDAMRGAGVWEQSVAKLRTLNDLGFGVEGSGLVLNLVANPAGAFLPPSQKQAERRFRADLLRKQGIVFNALFTFANVPLGRFRDFLERSGNLSAYLDRLAAGFNPCTVSGLMCRSQLCVDWNGRLYDCDFNLAAGLLHGGGGGIAALTELPAPGTPIAVGDHCFACTVGSGFT